MLNSGKKNSRLARQKKINILTLVLSEIKTERNKNPYPPPPPCKLNGRSLKKFLRPLGFSDDNYCTKAWYAPYWFLLAIQGLTHNLPKRFLLYC